MAISDIDQWAQPGMGTPSLSSEAEILWGTIQSWQIVGVNLDSTAVDASQTVTTTLQRGLVLGRITSSGLYKQYDSTATDGTQIARGVLYQAVNMLDASNVAAGKQGRMVWFGNLKASQINGLDTPARRQLSGRIWFDDDFMRPNDANTFAIIPKAADYTVLATDNNILFTTRGATGAVNFTLPTRAKGLRFRFVNEADQNMTVTSALGTDLVTVNNLAASSVAFSTAGDKIGGAVEIVSNDNASKWLVIKLCSNAMTIA